MFFLQAEDGIRDADVTGVQTCALPIWIWKQDGGGWCWESNCGCYKWCGPPGKHPPCPPQPPPCWNWPLPCCPGCPPPPPTPTPTPPGQCWCCINGQVVQTTPEECREREGQCYP